MRYVIRDMFNGRINYPRTIPAIFSRNLFIFLEYRVNRPLPPPLVTRYVCLSDLNSRELRESQCVTDNDARFNYSFDRVT